MLVTQTVWMLSRYEIRRYSAALSVLLLCLIGLPVVFYVVAGDVVKLVFIEAWNFQYRFLSIFDIFSRDVGFGTGSRFEIWAFAINRLDGVAAWFGSGFDYMNRIGCEFSVCGAAGTPHMPILAAFLYGGVIAAVAACAVYVYVTLAGWRLLDYNFEFAWLFFPLLATLLFGAISGNGPLSIRSYIILGAACVGFLRAIHVELGSRRGSTAFSTV